MKDKVLNIVYFIPAVAVASAFYYFIAINPPHWLNTLFQALMVVFFLCVSCVWAFVKVKDWIKKKVKKIVKEVLEGE